MNLTNLLDIAILAVILVCGFEVLRTCNAFVHPLKALSFVLITGGAFGWIMHDIEGHPVQWFAWLMHSGFALCALLVLRNQQHRRRVTDRRVSEIARRLLARH